MTEEVIQPPAWLVARVEERLALMRSELGPATKGLADFGVVMTPLRESPLGEDATHEDFERWERSCDNCETFCPEGDIFYTGTIARDLDGTQVIITFGMCPTCREAI